MKKNKNSNKVFKKVNFIFILIFAIAIILVLIELNLVIEKRKELPVKTSINTKELVNNINKDTEKVDEIDKEMSFESFVDRVYTEEEIQSLSSDEMRRVRQVQIDKKNTSDLAIKKICGSASSENMATRVVTNLYENSGQAVRSSKVILEAESYYIIKVESDYVKENVSRRSSEKVVVFKDFYYDVDDKILNMDDINKVKSILDLKYYIETYSNTGKNIIQSFIKKNGETSEYVIYYFDVEYGEEGDSNRIYLTSDTLYINSETGLIESTQTNRIGNGVIV